MNVGIETVRSAAQTQTIYSNYYFRRKSKGHWDLLTASTPKSPSNPTTDSDCDLVIDLTEEVCSVSSDLSVHWTDDEGDEDGFNYESEDEGDDEVEGVNLLQCKRQSQQERSILNVRNIICFLYVFQINFISMHVQRTVMNISIV